MRRGFSKATASYGQSADSDSLVKYLDDEMMSAEKQTIGWIGTGVMGCSMAGHVLRAGYPLCVFTRTKSKAEGLLEEGSVWCESPAEVAARSEVVFTIVGHPADVEEVYLGSEGILSGGVRAEDLPRIAVDMTTSRPGLAERIAAEGLKRGDDGVRVIDAPVSGGDVGARNGTLSIMVGGDEGAVEEVRPIFEVMGKKITHMGGAGAGQHTKMVNQTLIATMMIGVCEGMLYAVRAGLDPMRVIEAVGSGAAGSWSINNLGPRIVRRDFEPGFFVDHFVKDMRIALDEARRMNLCLPGLALAEQLYNSVKAQGYGLKGTQALMLALEGMSGV